jgi:hypothetical protein
VCVRLDPSVFALFEPDGHGRWLGPQPDAGVEVKGPCHADGVVFDQDSSTWLDVPEFVNEVVREMAYAWLPVHLLARVLEPWEWAVLVCLLMPDPELAHLLPKPRYLEGFGVVVDRSPEPWLPLAVKLLAAVRCS